MCQEEVSQNKKRNVSKMELPKIEESSFGTKGFARKTKEILD
jgi:hypothetical protein